MMVIVLLVLFASFLCLILILTMTVISLKSNLDREKLSPFECGFDPLNSSRLPFSIQFFMIAIIFMIFDVEIALLVPVPLILSQSNNFSFILTSSIFLLILLMGLLYEWKAGELSWMK